MAITNAQQYQQLVNPPMKGNKRPGYRGDDAYGGGSGNTGGGNTGGGKGDARDRAMGLQGKTGRKDTSLDTGGGFGKVDRSKVSQFSQYGKNVMAQNLKSLQPNRLEQAFNLYKKYSPLGMVTRGLTSLFGGPKTGFSTQGAPYGNVPGSLRGRDITSTDDDDDNRGGGDGIPTWMQLGYPSQQAYMAAMQRATQAPAGLPAAVMPMQTMDLNRIAYRLMADGGFLGEEDEPRQAYGLGSIVRKITRPIKKVVKKATKAVKKVTKSPLGRLALAVAAPYALGPAMAQSQFLAGLSAAKKAALISGATTGITQLASGEDLDLKDIALSAAIGGGTAKMFPPGGAPKGVDPSSAAGQQRVASDIASGTSFARPTMADVAGPSTSFSKPNMFDVAGPVRGGSSVTQAIKNVTPEKTGILQTLKDLGTKVKDSKLTDVLLRNKEGGISPMKSILLASGLSGLMAKKDFEEDEFSEIDRGEGIDIAAIRRRPFEYMAPRFAGSEFDFYAADGGRIGYQEAGAVLSEKEMKKLAKSPLYKGFKKMYSVDPQMAKDNPAYEGKFDMFKKIYDQKFQKGGKAEPVAKKVMPLLDMGGMEKDYRAEGGFVPIGRMEKADDVPARLSKNEFVFTADAVRNAGDGDVDKGAEVMYNMMKNLEAGGDVSEESQGLKGARRMFQTSQRLEEVL